MGFDSATRGPLGSLLLLRKLGFQNPLASCGAVITILMLGVDPFTQQIIRYYNCSQPIHTYQATRPRTNVCKADGDFVSVDFGLQDAISSGIYAPGRHVTPSCATGNCTFSEPYDTLAYCSSCTDLTDQVQFNLSDNTNKAMICLPSGTYINTAESLVEPVDVTTMNPTYGKQVEFIFVPNLLQFQASSEDRGISRLFPRTLHATTRTAVGDVKAMVQRSIL